MLPTPLTDQSPTNSKISVLSPSLNNQSHRAASRGEKHASASADQNINSDDENEGVIKVSHSKKMVLLSLFSLGLFMDIVGFSVFFILLGPTGNALGIAVEEQTWVITSYGVTFAAFLVFWGRVSDLYSPKPVFIYGFIGLGVTNLIISFLTEPYSFYIMRAISGVSGACLVPAAYRLIVAFFTKEELSFAFAVYGISGSIANSCGLVLGGAVLMIPGTGQMSGWRWHFRIVAALILPAAAVSYFVIPKPTGKAANSGSKLKRLDITGLFLILSATLLLIVSLTLGASHGFNRPAFYVPFIISLALFPAFFFWESRQPTGFALLPTQTWKYQNFTLWIVLALLAYAWWAAEFVPHAETYMQVHHEQPIIAALRLLPQGATALVTSVIYTKWTKIALRPRLPVVLGLAFGMVGYVLFISGGARPGRYYWGFTFPGSIIGPFALHTVFNCINVGAMVAVPASEAGVAGAIVQTSMQIGSIVALSIQAGLLTVHPGSYHDLRNTRISWYFILGWTGIWLVLFLIFYRRPKIPLSDVVVGH